MCGTICLASVRRRAIVLRMLESLTDSCGVSVSTPAGAAAGGGAGAAAAPGAGGPQPPGRGRRGLRFGRLRGASRQRLDRRGILALAGAQRDDREALDLVGAF